MPKWWGVGSLWNHISELNIAFHMVIWSNSGYECIGACVEELKDPQKNLTFVLILSIILSTITYLVAIIGPMAFDTDYDNWSTGYYTHLGEIMGGPFLRWSVVIGAGAIFYGTYLSLGLTNANELRVLGEPQYLGIKFLTYRSKRTAQPDIALCIQAVVITGCAFVPFEELLVMVNVIHSFTVSLVGFAFIALRWQKIGRNMPRPFVSIKSDFWATHMGAWPIIVCAYLLLSSFIAHFWLSFATLFVYVASGFLYFVVRRVHGPNIGHAYAKHTDADMELDKAQRAEEGAGHR